MNYLTRPCLFICLFLVTLGSKTAIAQFETLNFSSTGVLINSVSSLYVAGNGQVWIGTESEGLHFFDNTDWTSYTAGVAGFPHDYVSRVKFVDAKITVTTRFNGAAYFNGSGWTSWDVPSQIMDSEVRDVAKDAQGNIWFPTYLGVSRDSTVTGIWKNFTPSNFTAMPTEYFHNVFVDTNNDKWFGSPGYGIFILRSGAINSQVYTTTDGLPSNYINKVIKVGSDYWVATNAGIAIRSGSTWSVQNSSNNGSFAGVNVVMDMVRASNGKVYLATDNGLVYYHNGAWGRKDNINSDLPENNLTAVGYDELLDELWIGTSTSGVAKTGESNLTTATTVSALSTVLSVYPNPLTESRLTVEGVPARVSVSTINLLNAEGNEVARFSEEKFLNQETIQLDLPFNVTRGIYLLKIVTSEGTLTKKIVKQ